MDAVILAAGGRSYGVALSAVREVLRCGPITPVPSAPPAVVGAINAAGQVLPLIDVGALLGEPAAQPRVGDPGLWVQLGELEVVLLLGRIVEVAALQEAQPSAAAVAAAPPLTRALQGPRGTVLLLELPLALQTLQRQIADAVLAISAGPAADGEAATPAGGDAGAQVERR